MPLIPTLGRQKRTARDTQRNLLSRKPKQNNIIIIIILTQTYMQAKYTNAHKIKINHLKIIFKV